jgi:hypothetical protein
LTARRRAIVSSDGGFGARELVFEDALEKGNPIASTVARKRMNAAKLMSSAIVMTRRATR